MRKLLTVSAAVAALSFMVGCQSKDQAKDQAKEKPAATTNNSEQYTRSTPTGSWISKRVKKSEATQSDSSQAQEAMRELQRRGNRTPSDSGN